MKIHWKRLLFCLLVPLGVGGLAAFLTAEQTALLFDTIEKPPLTPPSWVFPVVWSILYLLMGYASYRIAHADKPTGYKNQTLILYAVQLFFNFVWSLIFFNMRNFGFAFVWLIVLWGLILWLCFRTFFIDRIAFGCLVPYLLWVTFAGYLNLMIYLNN